MAKRYYWLKLKEDFFKKKEMKKLRKLENGDTCILIYMKMIILSLESENKIFFDNVEDTFAEELSLLLDEDVDDVQRTLDFLEKVNLMETINEGEYFLPQGTTLTGSECSSAERVRKHRANKKSNQENKSCIDDDSCNKSVTLDIDTDIDEDKEIEQDGNKEIDENENLDKNTENQNTNINAKAEQNLNQHTSKKQSEWVSKSVNKNLAKIVKTYEENIGPVYPASRQWFIDISEKIEAELFVKAVEICIDKSTVTHSYLKGIIRKWIDENIFTYEKFKEKEQEYQNRKNMTPFNRDFSKNTYSNNSSSYTSSSRKPKEYEVNEGEAIDPALLEEIKAFEVKLGL